MNYEMQRTEISELKTVNRKQKTKNQKPKTENLKRQTAKPLLFDTEHKLSVFEHLFISLLLKRLLDKDLSLGTVVAIDAIC